MDFVMSERDELIGMFSDTYKDAYGIRPRWMNFDAMSNADIEAGINDHCKEASRVANEEKIWANEKVVEFKELVDRYINEFGASDEKTALRWISQTETFYNGQDVEHFIWNFGILFTDYGRALVQKLAGVVTFAN